MKRRLQFGIVLLLGSLGTVVAQGPQMSKDVQQYVKINSAQVVLEHVRIIDGSGKPAVEDQNVVIENGKITAIKPGADVTASGSQVVIDLRGRTVLPGLVGMHDHMYYIARPNLAADGSSEPPLLVPQMTFSRSAPLPCRRCDDAAHHRERGALHGSQPARPDRPR